jgi:hypothetical protein
MAKYLIDANLPYYFGLWNNPDYILKISMIHGVMIKYGIMQNKTV